MTVDMSLQPPSALNPSQDRVETLSPFLRLIVEPNRLRILALLAGGEHCVCDIERTLDLPQNLTSHHLGALKRAGLVSDRRDGRWVYYRLVPEAIGRHLATLVTVLDVEGADRRSEPCDPARGS